MFMAFFEMIDFASGIKNTPISSYRNVVKKDEHDEC